MTRDESPAEVAASNAAPSADDAPRAETHEAPVATPAEPTAKPNRRRAPASRSRARKTDAAPAVSDEAQTSPDEVDEIPPAPLETEASVVEPTIPPIAEASTPAPPKASRTRRRTTKSPETVATEAVPEPAPEPVQDMPPVTPIVSAAPASPAKRSRRPRKSETLAEVVADAPAVAVPSEPIVESPIIDIADIGTVPATEEELAPEAAPEVGTAPAETLEPPKKPARRRTSRKKAPTEEATETPAEAPETLEVLSTEVSAETQAPSETPEEAAPRGRRRGGRGRRKTTAAETTEAEVTSEATTAPTEAAAETETPAAPATKTRAPRRRSVRQPVVEEDLSHSGGRLVTRRGLVELLINGETYPPILFFGSVEGQKEARRVTSEIQRAAQSGIHIHSTLVELTCPLPPDDSVYEVVDSRIETLREADPKGYILPRIVFVPAAGWRRQYPNEVNHYADGSTDDPSIASSLFWMEAEHALTALIQHIQRMSYGERVIGFHLERGEWFHPADGGYDRSYANREAFRAWLRAKYKNSEAALRAAWYDGQVQFYTAEIPPVPAQGRAEMAFFEPRRERQWIDFLEFTSEVTAERLIALSKAVKQASNNRALVSVCYGYTYEFAHTFSGHLALGKLLEAPTIDIVAGPPSYRDRAAGGGGSYPVPADSMAVHGKLWLSEDDTKTHLAPGGDSPDDFNPRIDSRFGTEQVHRRAMGRAMAHQSGVAWMDTWGEGWLDAEDVWRNIGDFTNRYREFLKTRRPVTPELAVLVDERSLLHVQKGEVYLRRLLREQRDMIERSGASVGFYLQSDVTARNFPTSAKLYVFLTPYRLPADQRAAIKEKLQNGGKTLVWMYAPGVCDVKGEPDEGAHELVGITLRQQSWNMEVGSRFSEGRHVITQGTLGRTLGVRERLNPSFFVDDESRDVTVLAEYAQSGLPSVAVRELDGWRSVFCGEPTLSPELFRGLCRYAGVHLYTTGGDDYVFVGDGWLTLHATRDGSRAIALPPGKSLYDLGERRVVADSADNEREYRTFLRGRSTYMFYVGTLEEMRRMGLPGAERPPRGRRRDAAATPVEGLPNTDTLPAELPEDVSDIVNMTDTVDEATPDLLLAAIANAPAELAPDLAELFAPLTADTVAEQDTEGLQEEGDVTLEGVEEDSEQDGDDMEDGDAPADGTAETAEAAEQRRRRRRRGGRGRGRRYRPGGGPPPPAAG